MQLWQQPIIFLGVMGVTRAQHFIHLVIIGALGLVGLWMLHTLVQGFNAKPKFYLVKRSIIDNEYFINNTVQNYDSYNSNKDANFDIDWERIISNDPVGCARSFVCQLVATDSHNVHNKYKAIINLIRLARPKTWAGKELQFALNYGTNVKHSKECCSYYSYCPFSISTMMSILNIFEGT